MNEDAFKYKRPFSPDNETDELLKQWQTPDLTQLPDDDYTNALDMRAPVIKAQKVEEPEDLVVKPLTASDMEQIRQAAYEEGFAQGKEEGFSSGYAEGREQGLQDGTAQGLAEGKKQGLIESQEQVAVTLNQFEALIEQLQKPLDAIDKQVKDNLLQLSLAMAKAVINVEVKTNSHVILQAISDATSSLPMQSETLFIKLNPADLAIVEQSYGQDELAKRGWQLQAEPLVEQGGCVLHNSQSSVDHQLPLRIQHSLEHFIALANVRTESETAEE